MPRSSGSPIVCAPFQCFSLCSFGGGAIRYHFADLDEDSLQEFVVNASFHEQASGGDAVFSFVKEHAAHALVIHKDTQTHTQRRIRFRIIRSLASFHGPVGRLCRCHSRRR